MPIDTTFPRKERQRLEAELLRNLQKAQSAWRNATGEERIAARAHFMATLHVFNSVAIQGKEPSEE